MSRQPVDVVVAGGGIIGVSTAYWAARAGMSVVVCERRSACGLETSFANGGQISVSHAEPWANPGAPYKVLKWLFDDNAPLLFRPQLDWKQWRWIAGFLHQCLPHLSRQNTIDIIQLATYSRTLLQEVRSREKIEYSARQSGILHFYRSRKEFADAIPVAELMRGIGCDREVIDQDRILELEPAFRHSIGSIVGATYTATDESGDANAFTQGLAKAAERLGVTFLYDAELVGLMEDELGKSITGVTAIHKGEYERIPAKHTVVSLGSYSADFVRPYGENLNIYPAKGYSVSIPTNPGFSTPVTSLTDDEYKLVYSNLGTHLRVAGTAELSGYSRTLNKTRCEAIIDNVRRTFPEAGEFGAATFWTGLRPTTPSNLPYVRAAARQGLWLNTGHGTLGWTMGVGSGRLAIDLIEGKKPAIPWPRLN